MSGPPPPTDLATRVARVATIDAGTILHRFWTLTNGAGRFDPIHYDRSLDGRLNAPDASYGVLYAAKNVHGAFAETFLRTPGRRTVDPGLLRRKGYVRLTVLRPLKVIDFDGPNLAVLGATAAVVHGDKPYDNPQSWSAALRAHPVQAEGIAYSARHDPHQVCYGLFDAATPAVVEETREEHLDAAWFWDVADTYDVGVAPL